MSSYNSFNIDGPFENEKLNIRFSNAGTSWKNLVRSEIHDRFDVIKQKQMPNLNRFPIENRPRMMRWKGRSVKSTNQQIDISLDARSKFIHNNTESSIKICRKCDMKTQGPVSSISQMSSLRRLYSPEQSTIKQEQNYEKSLIELHEEQRQYLFSEFYKQMERSNT